jgi:hypothetical protein
VGGREGGREGVVEENVCMTIVEGPSGRPRHLFMVYQGARGEEGGKRGVSGGVLFIGSGCGEGGRESGVTRRANNRRGTGAGGGRKDLLKKIFRHVRTRIDPSLPPPPPSSLPFSLSRSYRLHPVQVDEVLNSNKQRMKADRSGFALQISLGRCVHLEVDGLPKIEKEQVGPSPSLPPSLLPPVRPSSVLFLLLFLPPS